MSYFLIASNLFLFLLNVFFLAVFLRGKRYFEFGFSFSGFYFLLIPLVYYWFFGELPVPIDFFYSKIPKIELEQDGVLVTYILFSWILINAINLLFSNFTFTRGYNGEVASRKFVLTLFFVYEVIALSTFFAAGLNSGDAHWAESKGEFMEESGTVALLMIFSMSGIRYALVGIFLANLYGRKSIFYIAALSVIAVTDLVTTGNRITTLVIAFGLLYLLLVEKRYKVILLAAVVSIPFGWFMTLYRFIRSQLHSEESLYAGFYKGLELGNAMLSNGKGIVFEFVSGITESVNVNVLYGVYREYGASVDFMYGSTYLKSLVFWIPRSIYPDKPITITKEAASVFAPTADVSLVTTALGESYANFGPFNIIFLPIFLLVFRLVVERFYPSNYVGFISFVYGVVLFRMAFSDVFLYMVFGALMTGIALVFSRYRFKWSFR